MKRSLHPATRCAHAREPEGPGCRPLVAPLEQTAVWRLDDLEQCEAVYAGTEPGYIYTRDAHPNHAALERLVADLEGAEAGLALASGMAAVSIALVELTGPGAHVLAGDSLYGVTTRFLEQELRRFGVEVSFVPAHDPEQVAAALRPETRALVVETLTNPLLALADLPALAEHCRPRGVALVVDNTFPTPCLIRPLEHGADVVLHSVTKLIGGHSDLTLGALVGSRDLINRCRVRASNWGAPANPFEAWLALRGAATLPLRVERACENAARLAAFLAEHPRVRNVYYPGLPTHPQHARCRALLARPGNMLSFELAGADEARAFLRALQLVSFAPSLGDTSTTVSYPAGTSHRPLTAERRASLGITDGLVRVSMGIDAVEDVIDDFEQALGT